MATSRASLIPGFRLYSLLQMVSTICTGMQCTVLPVFLVQQMGSDKALADFALAALAITTALPLVFQVIGGAAADYYNRWFVLLIAQAAALIQALALGLVALSFSPGTANLLVLALILPLNLMAAIITVFESPARRAIKSSLAPAGDKKLVEGLLQYYGATVMLGWRFGLGIGGLLVVYFRNIAPACFLINAASYILGIAALFLIRARIVPSGESRRKAGAHPLSPQTWVQTMKEGWSFVRSDRQIWLLFAQTMAVAVFFKRHESFLPVFAKDCLGGVASTGWLQIATTIGAFIGFLAVGRIVDKGGKSGEIWSYRAMILLCLTLLVLFAFAREAKMASLAIGVAAGALLVQEVCCSARIQSHAAHGKQGRIPAFTGSVTWAMQSLIAFPFGWATAVYGIRSVLIAFAACGTIVVIPLALIARQPRTKPESAQADGIGDGTPVPVSP